MRELAAKYDLTEMASLTTESSRQPWLLNPKLQASVECNSLRQDHRQPRRNPPLQHQRTRRPSMHGRWPASTRMATGMVDLNQRVFVLDGPRLTGRLGYFAR